MKIFNQKTVIGLFDRDKDVEKVVVALQRNGFGQESDDEVRIFDRHRLPQETPIDAPEQLNLPLSGQGPIPMSDGIMFNPIKDAGTESGAIQKTIQNMLTRLGLNDEEARFHAMHVARGSSLVIVDTTKKRAEVAQEVMQQFQSVVSEA